MKTTSIMKYPYPEPADPSTTWDYWQQLAARIETVNAAYTGRFLNSATPISLGAPFVAVGFVSSDANYAFPAGAFTIDGAGGSVVVPATGAGIYQTILFAEYPDSVTTARYLRIKVDDVIQANISNKPGNVQGRHPTLLRLNGGSKITVEAASDVGDALNRLTLSVARVAPLPTA